ncbi:MAG: hypothetical protein K0R83_2465 [Caulobacter sp.]|jgi:uncharacterized metal-binding protein YceD (DUF177 family)|nr:hypothetical protein [Caulobacter sp.]
MDTPLWSHTVTLADIGRGLSPVELTADAATRVAIARELGLERLDSLTARVRARPWLDGAEIRGSLSADVTQICSLSGEPFEQTLTSDFTVRAVPAGSDAAPKVESLEVDIDPEGDDPPDVLPGEKVDLAAYVVEHLALEVDPFPRKPGAVYEPPAEDSTLSPFAALAKLRPEPK